MKRFVYFFLIFSLFSFAQKEIDPIKVELLSVKRYDSLPNESCFVINYSIENVSKKDVSFILDTSSIIPTHTSSLNIKPSFQLYQNDKLVEISSLFTYNKIVKTFNSKEEFEKYDSILKAYNNDIEKFKDYFFGKDSERYFKSIKKLKPDEKLMVSIPVYWDKKRYYKEDELEYYLDEKDNYELKINVILWKEELKDKFLPEKYELIQNDSSFIKGWYSSNKLPINLK